MERVQLCELVGETVEAMRRDDAARLVVDVPGDLALARAAPEQIQRVLFNLIQNTIRHTPADGSVTVRAAMAGGGVQVEVADTGSGIADDDRERVFDAFFQGGVSAARSNGSAASGWRFRARSSRRTGGASGSSRRWPGPACASHCRTRSCRTRGHRSPSVPGPVLVTGGAGFIGSHVVEALLDRGRDVRVLDTLLPGAHRERPEDLDPRAEWVEGDLRDARTAAGAVAGVSAVSHQAAMVGLGTDIGDIADYVGHNDLGTAILLRALAEAGFGGRLVLASSMVVYGEGRYACHEHGVVRAPPRRPDDLDAGRFEPPCPVCGAALSPQPVPEDAPLDPRSVYAATKVAQETYAPRSRARPACPTPRCATTTSTGRACRGTRRTPAWPASSGPSSPRAACRACSRTAGSAATSST